MADQVQITPGSGVSIITDEVTDGTLGTGQVQVMKIMDATVNGTNKLVITAAGAAQVVFPSAQAVTLSSGTLTGITNPIDVSAATVPVKASRAATSAVTTVAAAASSTTLISSNANRLGVVIRNDSSSVLYIRDNASVVTSANATVKLDAGGMYANYLWTGEIRGIWASATGNAVITEYSA